MQFSRQEADCAHYFQPMRLQSENPALGIEAGAKNRRDEAPLTLAAVGLPRGEWSRRR
jgi:hypothetical protein